MQKINFFSDKIPLFLYHFFFGVNSAFVESKKIAPNPRFKGFAEFYEANILPKASACERIRINNLKKFILRCRLYFILIIALFIIFIWAQKHYSISQKLALESFLVTASLPLLWVMSVLMKFKIEIKKTLFDEIFRFLNLSYEALGSRDIAAYDPFLIIPKYDEKISITEDLISGNHNNVEFTFEEIHLMKKSSRRNVREYTTFKGCVIKLKFNKSFSSRTILKKDLGKLLNFSYKFDLSTTKNLQKINLEDVDFENMFEIYSSDQIEARYLLTTSFMERLKRLGEFFATKKIEASFFKNFLLIAFDRSVNLFEINSIFQEVDIASEAQKVLNEIALIYDLIDALKLNQKITL